MSNMPAARVPIAQAATKNVANRKTFWSHARYVLSDNPFTLVAVVLFAAFVLIAIAGRWIAPHDPLASNVGAALSPPSASHWFGTDALGRDILSRVLVATRVDFVIALSAVLASFAQLYRVNDATRFGNTVRLVVFDEAFNKMDSDRITESVLLLRKMGLQAIICTPPDKVSDIMPIADRTLLVDKSGYRMHIIPFGKEMQNEGSTGDPESSAG